MNYVLILVTNWLSWISFLDTSRDVNYKAQSSYKETWVDIETTWQWWIDSLSPEQVNNDFVENYVERNQVYLFYHLAFFLLFSISSIYAFLFKCIVNIISGLVLYNSSSGIYPQIKNKQTSYLFFMLCSTINRTTLMTLMMLRTSIQRCLWKRLKPLKIWCLLVPLLSQRYYRTLVNPVPHFLHFLLFPFFYVLLQKYYCSL